MDWEFLTIEFPVAEWKRNLTGNLREDGSGGCRILLISFEDLCCLHGSRNKVVDGERYGTKRPRECSFCLFVYSFVVVVCLFWFLLLFLVYYFYF